MLAIVIPYYKITFFEATLESLATQTNKQFKVYIGNDASPEDPVALLEKYKGQFDFVYHKFEKNLGGTSLVKQWERCIDLVKGEKWIMILGDDDVLGLNVVEEFFKCISEKGELINVIRFSSCKIDNFGSEISKIHKNPIIEKSTEFIFRKTRSSLSEYIFKKEQVINIGFKNFPLAWFSDVLAVIEFSNFDVIYSINKAIVYIRISEISISGKKDNLYQKNLATFNYYYYLLSIELNYFTNEQKKILQNKLNKCYINDKKNILMFIKITKTHFFNFQFIQYFGFLKLIFFNVKIKILKK